MKTRLREISVVAKVLSATIRMMALWAVLSGGGQPAYATHFRYGHISWVPVTGNTVQFTIQNAFRRSFLPFEAFTCLDPTTLVTVPCSAADGLPGPGDVFQEYIGGTQLLPGDGSFIGSPLGPLLYVVTSIDPDPTNEWLFALALDPVSLPVVDTTITHTYPSAGNFTAAIDSCCRISAAPFSGMNAHINNPDGGYRVETLVNVDTGNSSPVSALPPIILCPVNALCSFLVPGADPNGDPLNFRLSTSAEASSFFPASACPFTFCQPGPPFAPNAASISSTGLYTWDTTGATLGPPGFNTLYSTQVMIEDLDAVGNVKSKVAIDFFIQLVLVEICDDGIDNDGDGLIDEAACTHPPVFNNPPTAPACGETVPVSIGNTLNFTVQSSDPDPDQTVTLNAAGLPAEATMTPLLPTTGNPVSSTFSWTPTVTQVGTHVITFTATDNSAQQAGVQSLCSITVLANVPGRMTGGGSVFTADGVRVTHGFELHCDANQEPNNLQVNWGKGNKFHLESLTSASCNDDPAIEPNPPAAGFDTYKGVGMGRYNGLSGATATWTFTDAGEPGNSDLAELVITDAGGNVVLSVSGNLNRGNHQAHEE